MLTKKKRLELISHICSESQPIDDLEHAKFLIDEIYKIAHPHIGCRHEEWENAAEDAYKYLKSEGFI